MHVQPVEICVRIGDDLREVVHLTDGSYDTGVCVVSIADARKTLAAQPVILMTHGLATITIRLVERTNVAVPKRRVEWRPLVYGAGSLAMHLGVLAIALWLGSELVATPSVANGDKGRRARIASRFASPAQTTKWAPKPEPQEAAITVDETPAPVPAVDEEANGGAEQDTLEIETDTGGDQLIPPPNSEGGQQRRFDPDASAEFDSVKVGAFSTVSTGRLAGEQYGAEAKRDRLIVVSCDATSCLVLGGEDAAPIRKAVEEHLAEITACYANQTGTGGKKIEIDLGLNKAGKVDNLNVGGLGDVGNCVADILKKTTFNQDA